jgi:hypothetical protein
MNRHLTATYKDLWIGRGGTVAWPPRSPDLTPLDFFLCGYIKALICMPPIDIEGVLIARIAEAAATIRQQPGIFESTRSCYFLLCRCRLCIEAAGRMFEHKPML